MDNQYNSIPVTFEKVESYDISDTRFTKVKIKALHTGLNFNNSIFNKETVNENINSIYNCPILAYTVYKEDGSKDYSDHREIIVVDKNSIKTVYKGMPYGVVPANAKTEWVKYTCSDGVEREFLEIEGLIWNKLEDSSIILNGKTKRQSMELNPESISGHFDKENHFVYDSFLFEGFCMLGDDVQQAMIDSVVTTNFSVNLDEIKTKLEQFNTYFTSQTQISDDINNNMEGGKGLTTEIIDAIFAEFGVERSSVDFEINDETTEEALREYLTNFTASQEPDQIKNQETPTAVFSTYNEKRELLRGALSGEERRSEDGQLEYALSYWIVDFDENYAYVEKEEYSDGKWEYTKGRFAYSEEDGKISLTSEFENMLIKWVTPNEAEQIEIARNKFETAKVEFETAKSEFEAQNAEFSRLKDFEKETLQKEFETKATAIFNKFEDKLNGVLEYNVLKTTFSNMSLESIEDRCFSLLGRKNANFSVNSDTSTEVVNIGVVPTHNDTEDDGYGGLLSRKYNN